MVIGSSKIKKNKGIRLLREAKSARFISHQTVTQGYVLQGAIGSSFGAAGGGAEAFFGDPSDGATPWPSTAL
ncbi:hypothetical protein FH972_002359 [Carpinus fangiana]|uniref:Uncharacterized protein n=1 Tax=Carpinus fangiana TaxID=176857 RepID=A0A5N6QF55_9ROSI|nr:hypothetical protein FH972_002359 [Carpinus fangiana]